MSDHKKSFVGSSYLEQSAKVFNPIKSASIDKMEIKSGDTVLEVGSGAGIDTAKLSPLVGDQGRVIGVDLDESMVLYANDQATNQGLQNVEHVAQDANNLSFDDNTFDSVRSERMFMYLQYPRQVLTELARVTKSGGRIVVVEPDWASLSISCKTHKMERIINEFRMKRVLANGFSGRNLYGEFNQCKLSDIDVSIFPLFTTDISLYNKMCQQSMMEDKALEYGAITMGELSDWRAELNYLAERNRFFCSMNIIVISATNP